MSFSASRSFFSIIAGAFLLAALAMPNTALSQTFNQTRTSQPTTKPQQDRVEFYAGAFDINDDQTTAEFRAEYHWTRVDFYNIHPFLGIMATGDEAVYGYGGIRLDWRVARNWYVLPSFAAGLFEEGDGKDLGHAVEFKSEIGLAYEFWGGHRVGASISHMSNASLDDNNPGAESAMLFYSLPVRY